MARAKASSRVGEVASTPSPLMKDKTGPHRQSAFGIETENAQPIGKQGPCSSDKSPRLQLRRHSPGWPDTAMAQAYLTALVAWVRRHMNDSAAKVVLPVGLATAAEVGQVLRAFDRAQRQKTTEENA
jgi:hypothetical protein